MVKVSLSQLINQILSDKNRVNQLAQEYAKNLKNNKKSAIQENYLEQTRLKRRIKQNLSKVYEIIYKSFVVKVKYSFNGTEDSAMLVNLSDEDIKTFFNLMGKIHKANIEVLEIIKIPTYFYKGKTI